MDPFSLIAITASKFVKNSSKYYNFFLKDENDNEEMIGDYSNNKKKFKFSNIEKKTFYITNIVILISDNDTIKNNYYGSDIVLGNGLNLYVKGLIYKRNIFEMPIYKNVDWLKYNCNIEKIDLGNVKNLRITFNFHSDTDTYIKLLPTESLICELNDNYTSLLEHTINITGHYGEK